MESRYPQNPPPVPIGDAAKVLGVSVDTVRRWTNAGILPAVVLPSGHRRYDLSELKAFMDARRSA